MATHLYPHKEHPDSRTAQPRYRSLKVSYQESTALKFDHWHDRSPKIHLSREEATVDALIDEIKALQYHMTKEQVAELYEIWIIKG